MKKQILIPDLNTNIDKYLDGLKFDDTIIIYHDLYNPITIYKSIKWSEYSATYTNYDCENIVIIGLNRIRTSSNRYDLIFSYLYVMGSFKSKISIDNKPFTGEPWRVWYHQSFVNQNFLGLINSFPLEGEYRRWFLREINYCKLQDIKVDIKNLETELPELTTKFNLIQPNQIHEEAYQEIKKLIFDKYDTPKLIVSNILKLANKYLDIKIDFNSYLNNTIINVYDLPIYRFIIEENRKRLNIYNSFTNGSI